MSRPLPRFTNTTQADHQKIIEITGGTDNTPPITTTPHSWQQPNPADLRGVPVQARGVAGATPDTNPLTAILAKERHIQRHGGHVVRPTSYNPMQAHVHENTPSTTPESSQHP